MQRRDFLKRATLLPLAAFGAVVAASKPAEAASLFGTLVNVFPGGFGPESLNGGDIVFKVLDQDEIVRTALVDKKTKIFISGQKVKYRSLLAEVYNNQAVLLDNLEGAQVIVAYKTGLKAKQIDISFPLPSA